MTKNLQQRVALTSTSTSTKTTIDDDNVSIKHTKKTTTIRKLYTWDEIPEWQKDNEHIIAGYVRETNSFRRCFDSLFYIHNETGNVYSHLVPGVVFFLTMLFDKYAIVSFETTTFTDYLIINLFFLGAFTCLILSSTFHCFKSHSLKIATFGNKLDYLGIVVLIVTSMISILFYGFYDNGPFFYGFSLLTLSFGSACAIVSLKDKFRSREWRPYRAGLFVAFGLSAVLPILTGVMYYGPHETWTRIQLKWVVLEGVFYIFGAFLYGIRSVSYTHLDVYKRQVDVGHTRELRNWECWGTLGN